jgi:hypothetical protein
MFCRAHTLFRMIGSTAFRLQAVLAAVAFWAFPASAEEPLLTDIKATCVGAWSDDYAMQEHCIRRQVEALNSFSDTLLKHKAEKEPMNIAQRCMNQWQTKTGGNDWKMVLYCWNKQYPAYLRMTQPSP